MESKFILLSYRLGNLVQQEIIELNDETIGRQIKSIVSRNTHGPIWVELCEKRLWLFITYKAREEIVSVPVHQHLAKEINGLRASPGVLSIRVLSQLS